MSTKKTPKELADLVAHHGTTLVLLDTARTAVQKGDMHHSAERTARRIVALCTAEMHRQVKKYDAVMARIASGAKP